MSVNVPPGTAITTMIQADYSAPIVRLAGLDDLADRLVLARRLLAADRRESADEELLHVVAELRRRADG